MKKKSFIALIHEICRLVKVKEPERFQHSVHLDVDGITFTLIEGTKDEAGTLTYFCHFGAPPAGEGRAEVLERLLQMNLVMYGISAPSFSINYENSSVLLMGIANLEKTNAARLLNLFAQVAAEAKRWRKEFFLDEKSEFRRKSRSRLQDLYIGQSA